MQALQGTVRVQPFTACTSSRSRCSAARCSVLARAQQPEARHSEHGTSDEGMCRRDLLASVGAAVALGACTPVHADEGEGGAGRPLTAEEIMANIKPARDDMTVYLGYASPPTSYGGYGGNASEDAKYFFSYPSQWKVETVNKVRKGMQGIDCVLYERKGKGAPTAYVVTFSRAGEDNKSFRLNDIESTFQGFAGADYDLQDAITDAISTKQNTRMLDGETYYDYEIEANTMHYLSTVTVQTGKVFALFVKASPKAFSDNETQLRLVQDSFRTIPRTYKRSGPQ